MTKANIAQPFPFIPATKRSLAQRKPVYGFGINDAPYVTKIRRKGEPALVCPYYRVWRCILQRAYCPKLHVRYPTYKSTTIDESWHSLMNFRGWMDSQEWEGKEIDKDILVPGNKHYSPEFCVFVTQRVNSLLTDNAASRGKLPIGVCQHKRGGRFMAKCHNGERQEHLGRYDTPEQAHAAYCERKAEIITEVAMGQINPKVRGALLLRAQNMISV